jgi:hypothetical protein
VDEGKRRGVDTPEINHPLTPMLIHTTIGITKNQWNKWGVLLPKKVDMVDLGGRSAKFSKQKKKEKKEERRESAPRRTFWQVRAGDN